MNPRYLRRAKMLDRLARWCITVGGLFIIACVMAILFLIASVSLPLFTPARARITASFTLPAGETPLAVCLDAYKESVVLFTPAGARIVDAATGTFKELVPLAPPSPDGNDRVRQARNNGDGSFTLLWEDGGATLERVSFTPFFDPESGRRTILAAVERVAAFPPLAGETPLSARGIDAGDAGVACARLLPGNRLDLAVVTVRKSLAGGRKLNLTSFRLTNHLASAISAYALSHGGRRLVAGTADGHLLNWELDGDQAAPLRVQQAFEDRRSITCLAHVFGEASVAVGDDLGGLSTWFLVAFPESPSEKRYQMIHRLESLTGPVQDILPSRRDKSLLSRDQDGRVFLDHMTSERRLLPLPASAPVSHLALSETGEGLLTVDTNGHASVWSVRNPHPEVSWKTLFRKVWYEGYPAPAYVWQSSASTDDFEPKLSLMPVIFGTIKGTFYAMLFSLPLALLGAIYTSQFTSPEVRRIVKPAIEIMAAVPSVVIGFLAALWLAPLFERHLPGVFLNLILLPVFVLLAIGFWHAFRNRRLLRPLFRGFEFAGLIPFLAAAVAAAVWLGPLLEHNLVPGGDLKLWLFHDLGIRYDPRNSVVISFALGFAVIPVIFTIAEDSLSNVPYSLTAASLALGASRWQTVSRVILPSASPGIFAAIMIGLGRAVGETMIVLMATGNTPLMSWSPFNGMRTMSANIAVEIPEAEMGGTLYRVLFLSAVLLFLMTFVLNTLAEVVRHRLRRKYGRF
jgi:phosphate transport system permease protein